MTPAPRTIDNLEASFHYVLGPCKDKYKREDGKNKRAKVTEKGTKVKNK